MASTTTTTTPRYSVRAWLAQEEVDRRGDGEILGSTYLKTDELSQAIACRDELGANHGPDYAAIWDEEAQDFADETEKPWAFEGYWAVVLGAYRSAEDVVSEFGLDPRDHRGLDEWLGHVEAEAWSAGGEGPQPPEWETHHQKALASLQAVTSPDEGEEVTAKQIRALREEALAHGDDAQATLCDVALGKEDGDHAAAWRACAEAIAEAEAMHD